MFQKQVEEGTNHFARNHSNEHEELLKPLKKAVVESTLADHKWDSKALDYLVRFVVEKLIFSYF
jgi:hypothetical protein